MCILSSKRVTRNLVSKQQIPAVSCHTSELSVSKYTMKLTVISKKMAEPTWVIIIYGIVLVQYTKTTYISCGALHAFLTEYPTRSSFCYLYILKIKLSLLA